MGLLEVLQTFPAALILTCLLLGLVVGSFLNVVIYRLPKMMEQEWHEQCLEFTRSQTNIHQSDLAVRSHQTPIAVAPAAAYNLLTPRSSCPHCRHPIGALENIPVISYVLLGGKCKACRMPISPRYPIIEASSGVLCALAATYFGFGMHTLGALLLIWLLLTLTAIDFDTMLLPDDLTLPLLWIGLLLNLFATFTDLHSAVIGAIVGYLALWSVYWLFKLTTGKEGMGYGDFKLLAALGAWFGWQMLPLILVLSSMVGATIGIGLMIFFRHGRNTPIPFGPYLAGGGLIALFWGEALTRQYLHFIAP